MAEITDAALVIAGKSCYFGDDRLKYLKKFEEWYEHSSLKQTLSASKTKRRKSDLHFSGVEKARRFTRDAALTDETRSKRPLRR